MSDRNTYVKRYDLYLVRYVNDDAEQSHIVEIDKENRMGKSLCGVMPEGGWSRRGGSIKVYETKCSRCNEEARKLGILK